MPAVLVPVTVAEVVAPVVQLGHAHTFDNNSNSSVVPIITEETE